MPYWIALLFVWTVTAQAVPSELDSLWEESLAAHATGDLDKAAHALNEWTQRAQRMGIRSPEAHYNLASIYWGAKRPAESAYQLLTSLSLSNNPFRNWSGIETLTEIEKAIGIKDGVSQSLSFRLAALLSSSFTWWMGAIAVWTFIGALLARLTQHTTWAYGLFAIFLISASIGGASHINRTYYNDVGIILRGEEPVPVYRAAQADEKSILVELPSGTLVQRGGHSGDLSEITSPVAGWIRSENLKIVN